MSIDSAIRSMRGQGRPKAFTASSDSVFLCPAAIPSQGVGPFGVAPKSVPPRQGTVTSSSSDRRCRALRSELEAPATVRATNRVTTRLAAPAAGSGVVASPGLEREDVLEWREAAVAIDLKINQDPQPVGRAVDGANGAPEAVPVSPR